MKWRCNIILAIMLGFTQALGAFTRLTPEQRHFISIDGSVGYASLTNNSSELRSGSGVAANIGVGYRLFHNSFLFTAGVEGYYMLNAHSMTDVQVQQHEMDNEGDAYLLTVDASNGQDICNSASLNIPILFGGEFKRFYFLAGPKISYNIWGQAKATASLAETGVYEEFIGVIANIPDRFDNMVLTTIQPVRWNLDVMAHLEVGYRLGDVIFLTGADIPKPKQRYYLSLYLDYGLLNIRNTQSSGNRLYYEGEGFDKTYYLTPALMSNELGSARVHQYSVGIKATILFELPQKKPCVFCKDDLRRKFSSGRPRKNNIYKD